PISGRIAPEGHLAVTPEEGLRALLAEVARAAGVSPEAAEAAVAAIWHMPDPVALARPLADLEQLFTRLRSYGARIAVATSDNRTLTQATLDAFGVSSLIEALACADDGILLKP